MRRNAKAKGSQSWFMSIKSDSRQEVFDSGYVNPSQHLARERAPVNLLYYLFELVGRQRKSTNIIEYLAAHMYLGISPVFTWRLPSRIQGLGAWL
jgi:hypothetical protein